MVSIILNIGVLSGKTVSIIAEQALYKWISKHIGEVRGKTVSITAVLYDVGNFKHLI